MRHHYFPALALLASFGLGASLTRVSAQQPPPAPAGLAEYVFGSPTGDEVELLEVINRARANPPAQGQRLVDEYNVVPLEYRSTGFDVNLVLAQFGSYPARPPLAFNVYLEAAAHGHMTDMIRTGVAQHNSPDGTTTGARLAQYGYPLWGSECVDGFPGYPGVTPDQENGVYELSDLGHRDASLEFDQLGEIEAGIAFQSAGHWSVEDFGSAYTPPLLTGVVFHDNAYTGFYSSGEGLDGVLVTSSASSFYAVTVNGAYSLPLDLAPAYAANSAPPTVTVRFTALDGSTATRTVTLGHTVAVVTDDPEMTYTATYRDASGSTRYDNAKADWVLPAVAGARPSFFHEEVPLSNGVYYLTFLETSMPFGYYAYLSDPHYLYHFDLGYEYVFDAKDGKAGVYLYDFASGGFFYTSPTFPFPYLYDFALSSMVYYYPDPGHLGRYNTNGVRYFYVFSTREIIAK